MNKVWQGRREQVERMIADGMTDYAMSRVFGICEPRMKQVICQLGLSRRRNDGYAKSAGYQAGEKASVREYLTRRGVKYEDVRAGL